MTSRSDMADEQLHARIAELQSKVAELNNMLGRRPCQNNRCVQFNQQAAHIAKLEAQLEAQLAAGGEPVGEVVMESMGVPGSDAQVVRFHMYKEIPPVGTKLYTHPQPAAPAGVPEGLRTVLWYCPLDGDNAKPDGRCYDISFCEQPGYIQLYSLSAAPNTQEKGGA